MDKKCPVYQVMDFLGKRWTMLILVELYKGKTVWKRYSELKSRLPGITPKMLSMRLKELGAQGLIKNSVDARGFPIKSKYRLTESGQDFVKIINAVKRWGLKWKVKNEHCETVNCRHCEM